MNMKNKIKDICHQLEEEYNIKILFAVESGSRLWRIESKDSDYDVRFVYQSPIKEYLRIHNLRDVIERKFDSEIDMVGFDLYKFVRLLIGSNPSVIEWLYSDIIYLDDGKTKDFFKDFIGDNFNPIALFHHYRSMCKNNYLKYLKSCEMMTYKKYLYAMRGLINAKWLTQAITIPPTNFIDAVNEVQLANGIADKVLEIVDIKKEGCENQYVSKLHLFEKYIEEFLDTKYEMPNFKLQGTNKLQNYIYELLGVTK